jgi:uncharacterized membrane protein
MTKGEFFAGLGANLTGIPADEAKKVFDFYEEYFAEAVEAGKTEEEILGSLDTPAVIAARVKAESVFAQAESKPSMANWLKVLLAVLGVCALPIAFPIAITVFAVIFAIFVTVLALIFALGVTAIALFVTGIAVLAAAIGAFVSATPMIGLIGLGGGLITLGLSIFLAIGIVAAAKALIIASAKISKAIYNRVSNKGGKKS